MQDTFPAEAASMPAKPKRPYRAPVLTLFGHVAALTQSVNCSASSDGTATCPSSGGGDMGMAP